MVVYVQKYFLSWHFMSLLCLLLECSKLSTHLPAETPKETHLCEHINHWLLPNPVLFFFSGFLGSILFADLCHMWIMEVHVYPLGHRNKARTHWYTTWLILTSSKASQQMRLFSWRLMISISCFFTHFQSCHKLNMTLEEKWGCNCFSGLRLNEVYFLLSFLSHTARRGC